MHARVCMCVCVQSMFPVQDELLVVLTGVALAVCTAEEAASVADHAHLGTLAQRVARPLAFVEALRPTKRQP